MTSPLSFFKVIYHHLLIYRSPDYDTVDIHTLMRNTVSHFQLFEFKTVVNAKFIFTVHFLIHVVKFDV